MASIALKEVGNGAPKYSKWFYGYDAKGVPWCAVFVSWLAYQGSALNKYIVKTDGAGCFAREGVAKGWGKWFEGGAAPKAGDVISFCWNNKGDIQAKTRTNFSATMSVMLFPCPEIRSIRLKVTREAQTIPPKSRSVLIRLTALKSMVISGRTIQPPLPLPHPRRPKAKLSR